MSRSLSAPTLRLRTSSTRRLSRPVSSTSSAHNFQLFSSRPLCSSQAARSPASFASGVAAANYAPACSALGNSSRSSCGGVVGRWRCSSNTITTSRHRIHTGVPPGLRSFPAWFVRGGTSNGLVIRRDALPPPGQWHTVLAAAMGSPDPEHARQLDGMGSGISSTSKIIIIGPPSPASSASSLGGSGSSSSSGGRVDVEFTFVQVGIRDGTLDMAGNCGNMSSIVGPAAWDMGLVPAAASSHAVELDSDGVHWATLRLFNTNTRKVMVSRFKVDGSPLVYCPEGDYSMDGVPGAHSKITMSFLDPAGAKTGRALPTGNPIDQLELPDGSTIPASLVDVGNPGVFVATSSLGLDDTSAAALTPQSIEADVPFKTLLEHIRRAGASKMGLDPNTQSVPKIVLLLPASARQRGSFPDTHIQCLAMSMGQAHRAVPLTLALCLGAAVQLPGTVASKLVDGSVGDTVRIGHPSGTVDVGTTVRDGKIEAAQLLRTGRVMMKGEVYY